MARLALLSKTTREFRPGPVNLVRCLDRQDPAAGSVEGNGTMERWERWHKHHLLSSP